MSKTSNTTKIRKTFKTSKKTMTSETTKSF